MALPRFLQSKISSPDTVRLLWLWTIMGFAGFARVFYKAYRPGERGHDIQDYLYGRDFVNVWFGGRLVREGKVSSLYPVSDYMEGLRGVWGEDFPAHNFSYPPHIYALVFFFGLLPYFPSLILWIASGIAALVASLRKNPFLAAHWPLLLLVAASPASLVNIASGQNGFFTAACFLGGLFLSETSPLVAGVLFGLLTMKPHLGLLIPFILLLRRNWRCIATACATTAVLLGFSLAVWGLTPWQDYATIAVPIQAKLLKFGEENHSFYHRMMPGPFSDAIVLAGGSLWSLALYGITAIFAFGATLWSVAKAGLTPRTIALAALATIIVLPYGFNYDMVMVAGALAIYIASKDELPVLAHLAFGLAWALPAGIYEVKGLADLPFASGILVLAFLTLWLMGRKEKRA